MSGYRVRMDTLCFLKKSNHVRHIPAMHNYIYNCLRDTKNTGFSCGDMSFKILIGIFNDAFCHPPLQMLSLERADRCCVEDIQIEVDVFLS